MKIALLVGGNLYIVTGPSLKKPQDQFKGHSTVANIQNLTTTTRQWLNTLRSWQTAISQTFSNAFFFLNENAWISLKISLKFVPKVPINNVPALAQIMVWHRPSDKPLSESMMVTDAYMRHSALNELRWVTLPKQCKMKTSARMDDD